MLLCPFYFPQTAWRNALVNRAVPPMSVTTTCVRILPITAVVTNVSGTFAIETPAKPINVQRIAVSQQMFAQIRIAAYPMIAAQGILTSGTPAMRILATHRIVAATILAPLWTRAQSIHVRRPTIIV